MPVINKLYYVTDKNLKKYKLQQIKIFHVSSILSLKWYESNGHPFHNILLKIKEIITE